MGNGQVVRYNQGIVDTRRILSLLLKIFSLLIPAAIIILLDQYTKNLVRDVLPLNQGTLSPWPWLSPFITITHIANTGVAFGSLQGMNEIFLVLVSAIALAIVYFYVKAAHIHWMIRLGLILLLGGNLGNLIDRVKLGYVTDFLAIRWFAVINLADACITTGVFLAVLGYWLYERSGAGAGQAG